jgi:class 3 adenylate cyclase
MGLADDLNAEVTKIFKEQWTTRDGAVVPDSPDLKLANDAVKLKGTVLYADLAESTALVKSSVPSFAAAVYKTFLSCACRIIRANGGEITSFDGDRVMAVYISNTKNTSAMRSAMQINHAVANIINPRLKEQYPRSPVVVRHGVGVASSDLFVARTGIRGANDLVWVGNAANLAAKLCGIREGTYASWITSEVFDAAHESVKTENGKPLWDKKIWRAQGDVPVYGSTRMLAPS